jgi:hypothetical protein
MSAGAPRAALCARPEFVVARFPHSMCHYVVARISYLCDTTTWPTSDHAPPQPGGYRPPGQRVHLEQPRPGSAGGGPRLTKQACGLGARRDAASKHRTITRLPTQEGKRMDRPLRGRAPCGDRHDPFFKLMAERNSWRVSGCVLKRKQG